MTRPRKNPGASGIRTRKSSALEADALPLGQRGGETTGRVFFIAFSACTSDLKCPLPPPSPLPSFPPTLLHLLRRTPPSSSSVYEFGAVLTQDGICVLRKARWLLSLSDGAIRLAITPRAKGRYRTVVFQYPCQLYLQ